MPTAVLICNRTDTGQPSPGLLAVLGTPIIEWQVRAMRRAGIDRIMLLAEPLAEPLATRLGDGVVLERISDASELSTRLSGTILFLAEGVIVDHRALRAMASQSTAPALMTFAMGPPEGAERIDRESHWAGAALLPAAMVVQTTQALGDWDLAATLLRVADAAGAARIAFEASDPGPPDDGDRRLPPPLAWFRPADPVAAAAAEHMLLLAAMPYAPGPADRFFYRPLAHALSRALAERLRGAALCWTGLAFLLLAVPLMAFGHHWPALALLVLAPLMDQAGRVLSTAQGLPLPRAIPDAMSRTVLVALAIASLALPLARLQPAAQAAPLLTGAGLLLFTGLRAHRLRWYRRRIGSHLDMRTPQDARIVGLMGPATSMTLPLLPFAAAGFWWSGLAAVAAWSLILFVLLEWRFLAAIDAGLPPPLA